MTYAGKRKRGGGRPGKLAVFKVKRPMSLARKVVPGYTRSGGYYGRYNKGPLKGAEMKFFDTSYSGTLDTTGEVLPGGGTTTGFCLIPQDTTQSGRIGRKCVLKSLSMKMSVLKNLAVATDEYHISLIWDKQANGAYPAYTDIYSSATSLKTFRNMANIGRFVVLKDWYFSLTAPGDFSADNQLATTHSYLPSRRILTLTKKLNIPLEFSSTTGAITELKSNNIFLVGVVEDSDDTAAFEVTARVRFSDF